VGHPVTAAATRDDLASVVTALTEQAAKQRHFQAQYEAKAHAALDNYERSVWVHAAAVARGTANGFEVSADMISKYVSVDPGYTRVVKGVTG
jgi:hypothetical protein